MNPLAITTSVTREGRGTNEGKVTETVRRQQTKHTMNNGVEEVILHSEYSVPGSTITSGLAGTVDRVTDRVPSGGYL